MSQLKGRSRWLLIGLPLAVLAAALIAGIFFCPLMREDSRTPARTTLRLAWIPQGTFAGDYVALKSKLWEQKGLVVDVRPGGFQFNAIKLVAAGEDTFGIASGPELILARAQGVPVVVLAVIIPDSPVGWVAKKSSNITKPTDFIGRRVGAQYGTHTEVTFEALTQKLGISLARIQRIPMQFDYTPFVADSLDVAPVYIIDQPVAFRSQGIVFDIIDPRAYGVNLGPGNVYFTSERVLREHPNWVKAFLEGASEGWRQARANPMAAASAIQPYASGRDVGELTSQVEAVFDFIKPSADYQGIFPPDRKFFQQTISHFESTGVISNRSLVDGLFVAGERLK